MQTAPNSASSSPPVSTTADASQRLNELSTLLATVDETCHSSQRAFQRTDDPFENKLVQARLGIASSLFLALKAKHTPTAGHCIRVAIGCSAWAQAMKLPEEVRDEIEIAALLHDIGKIGVPDTVLMKPGKLSADEAAAMEMHRKLSLEILRAAAASPSMLDIIAYTGAWYDGRRHGFDRKGDQLPLGSRMVSVFDAFDAMTTEHVYRRAFSKERAVAELFEYSGTQFDPRLVSDFCGFMNLDTAGVQETTVRRWLRDLHPASNLSFWNLGRPSEAVRTPMESLFHSQLLDSMTDAVAFIDHSLQIVRWNAAAEHLTGIGADAVLNKVWSPMLFAVRDQSGAAIDADRCPVMLALATGEEQTLRMEIGRRSGSFAQVDAIASPVRMHDGGVAGVTLLLHDASSQVSLEQRVVVLHEKATKDPLTGVSNRAEFDRAHRQFVADHLAKGTPGSLIICDIDFFKKVNDTYGHQAGDEALVSFANILKKHCRTGDMVARYGGEEFVLLCADCDNPSATRRAERIRKETSEMPQSMIGGRCLTASFGVTQVQNGDGPETMLNRADRALLQAKDNGRNQVVQLGSGICGTEVSNGVFGGWWSWFTAPIQPHLIEKYLATAVPLNLSVEKLRGFIADHHAEIVSIESKRVVLKIDTDNTAMSRRFTDRPVPFVVELDFEEHTEVSEQRPGRSSLRTAVKVVIRPRRGRDRRLREAAERARRIFASLKSYLVAQELTLPDGPSQAMSEA